MTNQRVIPLAWCRFQTIPGRNVSDLRITKIVYKTSYIEGGILNFSIKSGSFAITLITKKNDEAGLGMKNGVFWDVTQCGSYKNRSFGGA
jgi:hypothetical protein